MSESPIVPPPEPDSPVESLPKLRGVGWWQFLFSVAVGIAVVGWGAPWILAQIRASRITALVGLVGELRSGVGRYQADVGTMLPLDPIGQGMSRPSASPAEPWTLAWVLTQEVPASARGAWARFHGPYLRRVRMDPPPLGRNLRVDAAVVGTGRGPLSVPAFHPSAFGGDAGVPVGHTVVWVSIEGVGLDDFQRVDAIIDRFGRPGGDPQRQGEVLWSPKDDGTLQILILHR